MSGGLGPWTDQDVGSVALVGSASESGGTFTVKASGADIWGTADQFHFVYQQLSGDGEIVARVASIQNTSIWAKAGVMIRETLDANSKHAMVLFSSTSGPILERRVATGGSHDLDQHARKLARMGPAGARRQQLHRLHLDRWSQLDGGRAGEHLHGDQCLRRPGSHQPQQQLLSAPPRSTT